MNKYAFEGFCPICQKSRRFTANGEWFRDVLICPSCNSVVRERALALVLEEVMPNWRELSIHESSPASRGISLKMAKEAKYYIASQFFKDIPRGRTHKGVRSEDLEGQTFDSEMFDCVITLDVMEHVFNPERVYKEIWRTLRPSGYYIHTFPIKKDQVEALRIRAFIGGDGRIVHNVEPEFHGNPIDNSGSLVTHDYGYDIVKKIAEWAPFEVRITRFCDSRHGILGEYTEVITCRKLSVTSPPHA